MWRNRNFGMMVASLFISRAGDTFTFLALAIQVDSLYSDPKQSAGALASVLIAFALPQLVFGIFAGTFVDRWDRRRTMIVADLARAALIPGFLFLHSPADLPWAMGLAFAAASFGAFFYPARTALLPSLVQQDELMQANSWMQVGETFSRLAGPILAGVVILVQSLRSLRRGTQQPVAESSQAAEAQPAAPAPGEMDDYMRRVEEELRKR